MISVLSKRHVHLFTLPVAALSVNVWPGPAHGEKSACPGAPACCLFLRQPLHMLQQLPAVLER